MKWLKANKFIILVCIILLLGFLVRLIGITDYPNGLNCDEASIGYEAYSLLNYGIDRNGNSWPVFLEAWGSGQNALYMYIIMAKIGVTNVTVIRESGNPIQMVGSQYLHSIGQFHLCRTFRYIIHSHERAVDVLPVPVSIVYCQPYVQYERMQLVDR